MVREGGVVVLSPTILSRTPSSGCNSAYDLGVIANESEAPSILVPDHHRCESKTQLRRNTSGVDSALE